MILINKKKTRNLNKIFKEWGDMMSIADLFDECEYLYFGEKDYNGCLEIVGKILKEDPRNIGALCYKRDCLYDLGKYKEALRCMDLILERINDKKNTINLKLCALLKLNRVDEAYELYKSFDEDYFHDYATKFLAYRLYYEKRYEESAEIYLSLHYKHNYLLNYEIIDGFKRITNHTDIDLSEHYQEFYLSWIDNIKYRSEDSWCPLCGGNNINTQFSFCNDCGECIQMGAPGLHVECDDLKIAYYLCDKIYKIRKHLKIGPTLEELHQKMDYFDDAEFDRFIEHLKEIDYIYEDEGIVKLSE